MYTLKKIIPFILVIALIILFIYVGYLKKASIATESVQPAEKVKITFWFEHVGHHRTAIWENLIAIFEKEHPHIEIVYEGFLKDTAKVKFDAAIASGDVPDVGSIYTSWLPEYNDRDALLPLDSYFNSWSDKYKISQDTLNFNRSIVGDMKLYSIPYTQNLDVLWVRKDWLKELGMESPKTWNVFFDTIEKLTNVEENRYGYSIRGGMGSSFQLQRMMYAYSGISDYIKDGKSSINDPLHVEFLKKYVALYQQYTPISDITSDLSLMLSEFDNGTIGMIQHNIGSFAEHNEFLQPHQFEATPLPKSVNGYYVVEGGNTMGISIFKQTKHPDESWEFLSFLTSKEAQSYWNREVGQMPTHQEVFNETWAKEAPHLQAALKVYRAPDTIFYEPPFYLIEYNKIRSTIVEPGIQEILSGTKTVEQFLDEWAKVLEDTHQHYVEYLKGSTMK